MKIIAQLQYVPSVRRMQRMLLERGIEASIGTVQADFREKGISSAYADGFAAFPEMSARIGPSLPLGM
jgi:hypothetical protein